MSLNSYKVKVCYSDDSIIQMVIQIPTVAELLQIVNLNPDKITISIFNTTNQYVLANQGPS